jgi:hypothetical protein
MVAAPLWRRSPCWGHHCEASCFYCTGLFRVKPSPYLDVRRRRLWRRALVGGAASGDPWLGCGSGWLVVLPARSGRGGALGPCWHGGVEDPWVLEVLSWRTWCSGDPGDG